MRDGNLWDEKRWRCWMGGCAAAVALVIGTAMVGCSSESPQVAEPASSEGRAMSQNNAVPESQVGDISQAMVIIAGEQVLLVDTETQAPYYPTIPDGGLTDMQGNSIAPDQLSVGNVVEVTGNGIMLESYPGQYPGITAVRVLEEGTPADAEKYQALIDELTAPGSDGSVPFASVAYHTDLADTTVLLEPQAYTWEMPDGTVENEELGLIEEDGLVEAAINDARISEATDATVMFDVPAQGVAVTRMALSATASGHAVDTTVAEEAVECRLNGADAAFSIVPNSLYVVSANYEAGQVIYAFVALEPRS